MKEHFIKERKNLIVMRSHYKVMLDTISAAIKDLDRKIDNS